MSGIIDEIRVLSANGQLPCSKLAVGWILDWSTGFKRCTTVDLRQFFVRSISCVLLLCEVMTSDPASWVDERGS